MYWFIFPEAGIQKGKTDFAKKANGTREGRYGAERRSVSKWNNIYLEMFFHLYIKSSRFESKRQTDFLCSTGNLFFSRRNFALMRSASCCFPVNWPEGRRRQWKFRYITFMWLCDEKVQSALKISCSGRRRDGGGMLFWNLKYKLKEVWPGTSYGRPRFVLCAGVPIGNRCCGGKVNALLAICWKRC